MGGLLVLPVLFLAPSPSRAQEGQPYTLEQIEGLLEAGLSTTVILEMARPDCLAFRVDQATADRLTASGADSDLIEGLRGLCYRSPEPEVELPAEEVATPSSPSLPLLFSPTSAAMRSLAVPGLGQFYTGRPAVGVAFLAAWAGAIGFGIMSQDVTVECLAQTSDACPAGQVRAEIVERPMLPVGLGAAIAVAVISAFEARSGANRANNRQAAFTNRSPDSMVSLELLPVPRRAPARGLVLLQIRHR
jgi:hypothetical protein